MLKQVIRNNKGFSLVELMVVVAIIGILASIGIPQITKYMARARTSEAKANLSAVYTSNKAFYAEYVIYDNRFDVIGYRPEGKLRYNVGWSGPGGQCANLALAGYTAPPAGANNTNGHCSANPTLCQIFAVQAIPAGGATGSSITCVVGGAANAFQAVAIGRVGSTATNDTWVINQVKTLSNPVDGTN